MSDYGVKISKPDIDVNEAELKDLILSSSYPLLKIVDIVEGSTSLTDGGSSFDIQIYQHDLGYKPRFYLWATYYDPFLDTEITDYELMPLTIMSSGGVIGMFYTTTVDNSEIRFQGDTFGGDASSHDIDYYCIIYYDEE
jgi:hypothetical protein